MTLAAVTIDVDSLHHYQEIHGDKAARPLQDDPIYTVAMPRFWELLDGLPATLFLIGRDAPSWPQAFAPIDATGSEVASHSFAHDYRMTRMSADEMHQDLARAEAALAPLAGGQRPVGFRAPGYNQTPLLMSVLRERGYTYDSSLLPAPSYYAARVAAIGGYHVRGTPSRSLIGDPRAFGGPRAPYRMDAESYWRPARDGNLWELPIWVERRTRTPLIGTTWAAMPGVVRRRVLRAARRRSEPIVFEMHAIDLLDATDPGVPAELARRQVDLQVLFAQKRRRLQELFRALSADWDVSPLRSWPDALVPSPT